jgi:MFS superfamily sulfate permease-like transporter
MSTSRDRHVPQDTDREQVARDDSVRDGQPRRDDAAVVRPRVSIQWGSAFLGWLAAMGLAVLLTAIAAAIGAAVGVSSGTTSVGQATQRAQSNPATVGIVSGIVLVVILFVSYFCGGYVAGRMSRFSGTKQGLAVWIWAVVIGIVVAVLAGVAGSKYDVLSSLNSFPRVPVKQGDLTTGGVVALVVLLVVSLVGALAGGRAGMHYHRRLERELY